MAWTDYNLKLKISADNQATAELEKVSKQTEKIKNQSFERSKETEKWLKTLWATATVVAWSMVALWKSFIDASIENEPLQRSFERLSESAWVASDEMLKAMKKASRWTVSDTKLMAQANKAYSLWVVSNVEDMSTIMEIARVKGQAMWRTMEEALDDIVTWLWRWSVQILDNLWIVIKQTEAQEMYAKMLWKTVDQLTEAEKKQALTNAVVAQWKKELEEAWEVQETMQEKLWRVNAQWENMKNTIGNALIPIVDKLLQAVTPIIEKISNWVEENPELTATIFGIITAVAWLTAVFSWLALALPAIMSGLSLLMWPIWLIIAWITALAVAWATDFGWIREKTAEIVDKISEIIKPRLDKIKAWWDEWWWVVIEVVKWLWSFVEDIFASAFEIIWAWLDMFFQSIDVLLKLFTWDWKWAWEWICNIWETLRDTTMSVVDNLFGDALDWIAEKLVAFGDWFKNKWNQIKEWVLWIANALWEWLKTWMEFWIAIFTWDWETASNIAQSVMIWLDEALTSIFGQMWTNIKTKVQEWIDVVVSKITAFKEKVMSIINSIKDAWNSAKETVGNIGSGIKEWATNLWNGAKSLVGFANGGSVTWWTPIIVWERWPELFVPNSNWTIVPNEEITKNNNVTINMSGITIREDADITRLAEEIVRMTKLEKNYWII